MIKESLENAPIIDKDGYPYIVHPLTDGVPRLDPELLRAWVSWAKQQPCLEGASVLLAPEALAIPVATALSLETGIPMVIARKRSYGLPGETIAYCETGYGQSCIHINDIEPWDEVVVIDDLISTGGTLRAVLETLDSMGAHVRGALAVVEKGDGATALRAATDVPIAAMHRIRVDHDGVQVF